ncbi:MAG: WG repeat-containing protein [Bacteroidota bacterium]
MSANIPFQRLFLTLLTGWLLSGCGGGNGVEIHRWPIQENGLYGYIDDDGDQVIACQFAYGMPFSEMIGGVNVGGTAVRGDVPTDGKWGFIDMNGNFIINPKYDPIPNGAAPFNLNELSRNVMHQGYIFSEKLAPVYKDGRWIYIAYLPEKKKDTVYIDYASKVVDGVKKQWPIQSARSFSNGLAAVYLDNKWGYINYWGDIIIEPKYLYPVNFSEGMVLVMDEDLQTHVLDTLGNERLPFYHVETSFFDNTATAKNKFKGEKVPLKEELKYTLIDTAGEFLFEAQFDYIGPYQDGLCPVLIGSQPQELVLYPDKYESLSVKGGKWGYINRLGEMIHNPVYDKARAFKDGFAPVRKGQLWGYISASGSMLTSYEFVWAGDFHGGMAKVKLGPAHNTYEGKFAYLHQSGSIIYIAP